MSKSFFCGALGAAFLFALSAGSFGTASAQLSANDNFHRGSQILAELNALKCYDEDKDFRARSWLWSQIYSRGPAPSPSLDQVTDAVRKERDRLEKLPSCVEGARRYVGGPFSGIYIGGHIGGQRAQMDWQTSGITSINIVDPLEVGAIHASPADTGFIGGAFVGINFPLFDNFIAGVEVGLDIGGGESTINGIPGIGAFLPGAVGMGDRITIDNKWGASFVGHLGFLPTPQVHLYGLGGYAWQRADVAFSCDDVVGFCSAAPAAPAFTDKQTATFSGPVFGLGAEMGVGGGWVGRIEYRYTSLKERFFNLGDPATRSVSGRLDQDVQQVTFGLRYALGAPPPP